MKKLVLGAINKHKWSLLSITVSILVIGLIRQVFPYLFGDLIQSISDGLDIKRVVSIVLFYSALFIFAQLLHVIENITHANLFNNMLVPIRKECFSKFLNASRTEVGKKKVGEVLTVINEDVDMILDFISNCIINFISITLELLAILAFTTIINPFISLYVIFSVSFSFLVSKNAGKIVEKLYQQHRQNKSETVSFIIDVLEGRQEIKFMNAFSSINKLYLKHKMKQLKTEYNIKTRNVVIERVNALVSTVCNVGLMVLSAILIANNHMSMGNFISCALYFETALAIMNFYGYLAYEIPESKASINRVKSYIELKEENNGTEVVSSINLVSLTDLKFSFDDIEIIEPINVNVKRGELLFVEGPSGTGKTTLLKCILGLHNTYSGEVCFNNTLLKNAEKSSLRNCMSVCLQGDELIEGETLKDNLCMGEVVREEEIMKVLNKLNMTDFINGLEMRLNTVYSSETVGMSGGQKQRLLLARTLLKTADLYVFDEPIAELDDENEKLICDILNEVKHKSMVIITSHRKGLKSISDKCITIRKAIQETLC